MPKTMYTKEYHEEYARLTLGFLLPYPINNFVCKDKPDIQNETDGIGIEVTWAGTQDHLESQSYGYKYLGTNPGSEELKRFNGEFFPKEGKVLCFSPTKDLVDSSVIIIEGIKNAIHKKSEKYENYSNFKEMGLYCYVDYPINDIELKEIMELDISPFNFLIVNTTNIIYLIEGDKVECFELSNNDLVQIKKQVLDNTRNGTVNAQMPK